MTYLETVTAMHRHIMENIDSPDLTLMSILKPLMEDEDAPPGITKPANGNKTAKPERKARAGNSWLGKRRAQKTTEEDKMDETDERNIQGITKPATRQSSRQETN